MKLNKLTMCVHTFPVIRWKDVKYWDVTGYLGSDEWGRGSMAFFVKGNDQSSLVSWGAYPRQQEIQSIRSEHNFDFKVKIRPNTNIFKFPDEINLVKICLIVHECILI